MAKWVALELNDEEKYDAQMPLPMERPDYPCGLCLSFNRQTIEKLGIEELPDVGDLLDMRCFMEVTHVSDGPGGQCFETQITMILSPVENETTEMPEATEREPEYAIPEHALEREAPLMERRPRAAQRLYRKSSKYDQLLVK